MQQRSSTKTAKQTKIPNGKLADAKFAQSWTPPPFTLKQIRDAVPAHCFKRDTLRSLSHVLMDLSMVLILGFGATMIKVFPQWAQLPAWVLYWYFQGVCMTRIWVLAHECGHSAFSGSKMINDVVGFILHTSLLVPFFSWKYSHSKHHKATGSMEKDQVFIPRTRSQCEKFNSLERTKGPVDTLQDGEESLLEDVPLYHVINLILMLILGWPMYLIKNSLSQKHKQRASHFLPSSPIFDESEYNGVVISNIGMVAAFSLLATACYNLGTLTVITYYGIPYLFVNFWLVLITYLQHTDPIIPRYRRDEWNFMRGALTTIDRDFGFLNVMLHHITDTHVAHHLFSQMPFYHAQEATEAIKTVLGDYYLYDDTHFLKAAYNSYSTCRFVEDSGDIVWFKN